MRELARFLADSDEAHEAFVEHLFQFTIKQPVRALGGDELARLTSSFVEHDFHIRQLLVEMVCSSAAAARQLEQVSRDHPGE